MKRRVLLTLLAIILLLAGIINPGALAQKPSDQPVEPAEDGAALEQPPDAGRYRAPAPAPAGAGTLAVSYTYTNTTPVAIPDSSCPTVVTSTITVPDSFSIGDLNVGLWIEHTYRGDLEMFLVGPDATTVELYTDPDSSADNLNVLLDDSSPNVADTTSHNPPPPYYYAWWSPEGSLADFNGKDAQGEWELQLCDDAGGDTGTLQTWTLFFQSGLILNPDSQSGSTCKGSDVVYTFEVANTTAVATAFDLAYSSVWPAYGPGTTPVLAPGESWQFDVTVHIPWAASSGDQDTLTVTVSGAGDSDQATATTTAGLLQGYQDYTDVPRPVRDHGVVYWDGKIYKIGGYDGGYQAYLDIYDIATDTWSQGADIPLGRDYWDCDAISAKIYCAGGYNAGGTTELYIYDIGTDTWSTGAPLPEYRYTFASVALDGKYYVIGGYGPSPSPYYKDTIWAYDPGTDTWDTTLTPMSTGRRYHFAGVIGGQIYVAGGYNGSYLSSAEVYDPLTDTWSPIADMPSTWLRGGDAVKHDRYLLIFGGDDNSSAVSSDFALIYDALTDSWNWLPNMPHQLYATEADGDGSDVWISSGRLYEGAYRYSEYHTRVLQCPDTCDPISAADFSWDPDPGLAGFDITFTGVATGTPAINYEWDFGDGDTGLGQVVTHAYGDAGIYTVVMTATNCDDTGQFVVSHDVQVILPPTIDVTPDSLSASQCPEEVTSQDLLICNLGDVPLEWSLREVSPTMRLAGVPAPAAPAAERPVITSEDQCAAYETYAGAEPIGYAEFCMDYTPTPWVSEALPLAPTDIGYAQDIGYISDNFVTFVLNDFPGQTVLGTNTNAYYGMDFDPTATTLYALNDTTDELGTIDLADGTFTGLVPCVPPVDIWTGLTIDPSTGTFYASDATDLYIIDPATGNYTLVGPFNSGGSMIDIAMNTNGEMYGHDIGTDSIYQIDPATGAATLIGPTGYAANYAQGMDFDNDDGTLYIFLYIGSGANVYGTVDLLTGAVSPLAIDNPLGEFEGAIQIAGIPAVDFPWLTEVPTSGVVLPGECMTVEVTFDSSGMDPGDYLAGLLIESNDPATPEVNVPVDMTVLECPDIILDPLALETELCIDGTDMLTFTICNEGVSDLDWALHEYTPSVKFLDQYVVVNVPAREAQPGVQARSGSSARPAQQFEIHVGWVSQEIIDVLLVTPDVVGGGDISLLLNTLAAFPDLNVVLWDGNVGTPTVPDMLAYDVVFVGNDILWTSSAIDKTALSNNLADYIDAGGKVVAGSFVWSYDDWGFMGGRFITDDYSPYEIATQDFWESATLGAYDPDHPIMAGITNVTDGFNHQDMALSSTGTWIASWNDGENFVAESPNCVGLNQEYFYNAIFGGQVGELLHNALLYLAVEAWPDIPWISEEPVTGTVPAGECQVVDVTFDATGLAPGDYFAGLLVESNDPDDPEVSLLVTMTVLSPVELVDVTYDIADLEVTFDATATGSEPIAYAWDFGDGGTSTDEDPVHVYDEGGCYTVTLTVQNPCGMEEWSELICVFVPCEPIEGAGFDWSPVMPIVGETVTFSATLPLTGTGPFTYTWDFDDGFGDVGMYVNHTFAAAGTYSVTLMVENACSEVPVVVPITVETGEVYHYIYLPIVIRD